MQKLERKDKKRGELTGKLRKETLSLCLLTADNLIDFYGAKLKGETLLIYPIAYMVLQSCDVGRL